MAKSVMAKLGCDVVWHLKNPFPEGGTEEERKGWRTSHRENCGCRMGNKK